MESAINQPGYGSDVNGLLRSPSPVLLLGSAEPREQINPLGRGTVWLDLKTEGLGLELSFTTH